MHQSHIIFNILRVPCHADFNLPHLHLMPLLEWPHSNFTKIFGIEKLQSWGYHVALFTRFYV